MYLGASIIAAAAPTPGGLGALEAAVVAGLTGVGMESGAAVAAVLSYRLVTYWLPILPGWIELPRCSSGARPDLGLVPANVRDRQAFAAETERPARQRADQQPEPGAADDVERQVRAGVQPRDSPPTMASPKTTGRHARGTDGASTVANANATAACPET